MIKFKVSAPGKVILHGEHAVVYGKTAVATSIDLRTTVVFTELPETNETVEIALFNIDLWLSIPIRKIQEFFLDESNDTNENHEMLYSKVQSFISPICNLSSGQQTSLTTLIYSFVYIARKEHINLRGFRIYIETQLSIGSGLGSSASYAVCLAACFLHWSRLQKNILTDFDTANLEKISKYAFNCEKIMHGTPSGIDNSVCTYGSIVEFRKGEQIKLISGVTNLKIMLVNTGVERSTKRIVKELRELRQGYPAIIDSILNSIDDISKQALQVIGRINNKKEHLVEEYKKLITLINMNQGLLYTLQTSHPSLDKICAEAWKHGLAAKLTGAGGGGYAYVLLPPYTNDTIISEVTKQLFKDKFAITVTNVSCKGVTVHEYDNTGMIYNDHQLTKAFM